MIFEESHRIIQNNLLFPSLAKKFWNWINFEWKLIQVGTFSEVSSDFPYFFIFATALKEIKEVGFVHWFQGFFSFPF